MFLVPDAREEELREFIGYVLGLCLMSYGVVLHAACFMSNHYHLDVTDVRGELPLFKCKLNAFIARGINCLRGRFDKFWSVDGSCDTVPQDNDEDGPLGDLIYTLTNPVKDGLVKWSKDWVGFTTHGWKFGEPRKFRRPDWFFDEDGGDLPPFMEFGVGRNGVHAELTDEAFHTELMAACRDKELQFHRERRTNNQRFMGLKKLRKQHWNKVATTPEDRFTPTPKVAASSRWLRLRAQQRNRAWERSYAEAEDAREAGRTDYVYPYGTWLLRRRMGVKTATAPP